MYTRGKETIVDVLLVNEAYISDRGRLTLAVEAPKLVKDRQIGDYLVWERSFELPIGALKHHEPLHATFDDDGIGEYQRVVKKGLQQARAF